MQTKKEAFSAVLAQKGWSAPLIEGVIELAGGFEAFCAQTKNAWPMIFVNSLGNQIECLEEEESDLTNAIQVLEDVKALDANNLPSLTLFFDTHYQDIKLALNTQTDKPADRLVHLSYSMEDEHINDFFEQNGVQDKHKCELVSCIFYYGCYWLTELTGGLNTDKLGLLDLSDVTWMSFSSAQVKVVSNPKEKKSCFAGEAEVLYEVCDNYYLRVFWKGKGEKRNISSINIRKKDIEAKNTPVWMNLKTLSSFLGQGSSFLDIDITASKNPLDGRNLISLSDDTIANVKINKVHELEIMLDDSAILNLSGHCVGGHGLLYNQSRMVALGIKVDTGISIDSLNDDARLFTDAENIWVSSKGDKDSSYANQSVEKLHPEYIAQLRQERSEES